MIPGEQRSVAHTDLPSRSMATPLDPPHGRFSSVSWPQSRMTRYGLAPLLMGAMSGVWACPAALAIQNTTAAANQPLAKAEFDIAALPCVSWRGQNCAALRLIVHLSGTRPQRC